MIEFDNNARHINDTIQNSPNYYMDESQLSILKLMKLFLDPKTSCQIGCIIKIIELQRAIYELESTDFSKVYTSNDALTFDNILQKIKKEFPEENLECIKQIEEMIETIQLYKEMSNIQEE